MIWLYILMAFFVFGVYQLLKARYDFKQIKDRSDFQLFKIEQEMINTPENPILYCQRGTIYMRSQNFLMANKDFKTALSMTDDTTIHKGKPINSKILLNIHYTEKPHPWSKGGPKDKSSSWLTYFIIDRFGYLRVNF